MPLTAADRARMADTVEAHLPDTCSLYRPGTASSGYDELGGRTGDDQQTLGTAVATGLAFLLSPNRERQGNEGTRAGGVWADARWIGTLPAGTDVRSNDVIVSGGREYNVIRDTSGRSNELQVKVGLVLRGGTTQ